MTHPDSTPETGPLPATIFHATLGITLDALPLPSGTSPSAAEQLRQAAIQMFAQLAPVDALEAMLVSQIVAMTFHALEVLRHCTLPDLADGMEMRLRNQAKALFASANGAQRMLERRRKAAAAETRRVPAHTPVPEAAASLADTQPPVPPSRPAPDATRANERPAAKPGKADPEHPTAHRPPDMPNRNRAPAATQAAAPHSRAPAVQDQKTAPESINKAEVQGLLNELAQRCLTAIPRELIPGSRAA